MGSTKVIKDVVEPNFHDFVKTTRGPTKVHGSKGIFCNSLAEVRRIEMFSEYIFDDDVTVSDFGKMVDDIAVELTKIPEVNDNEDGETDLEEVVVDE